ncbi:MAG: diguanylate cyclase [Rhodanobacteraceae bacterium]|nr:diguanylate cyclase [Rhodanobacteraceae bacterium]MBL0040913.1 diguanylate cyclase [Xanthomonadales bacterium]
MKAFFRRLPIFVAALVAASAIPAALADSAFGHGVERAMDLHRIALGRNGRFGIEIAAATLYSATQDAAGAERHWRNALTVADSPTQRMYVLQMLAENSLVAGDYDAGIETAEHLQKLAGEQQHAGYRAQAVGLLGRIARRRGELQEAYAFQQESLRIARAANHPADAALALVNIGTVLRDMGRFSEAMDQQMQALDIRKQLGPGNRVDVPYRNIGLLYREIEDTQSAREYLEKAIAAAREEYDPAALSSALGSYATLLNDVGESTLALDTARRALAIDSRLGDRQGIALERLEAARALIALKRWSEARIEIDAGLRLGESMRQADVLGRALLYRGDLYSGEGQLAAAEAAYGRSLDYLTRAKLKPQLHAAYKAIEGLLEARGEALQALSYARQRAVLREELLGVTAARRLAVLELKQDRERAERQVEMLRLDNSLKELNLRTETLRRRIGIGFIATLVALLGVVFWRLREARRSARILSRKNDEISAQDAALRAANARLTAQTHDLFRAATTDPLTTLSNRGHVMQQMIELFDRHKAQGLPLSLLLIDLDRFKPINDSMGHQFGDRVLIAAARVLREEMRDGDPLGRYGGEEFITALPGASAEEALVTAERLRLAIQRRMGVIEGEAIDLTASIGLAELHETGATSLSALIATADDALYRAKALGRNRTEISRSGSDRRKPT